MKRLGVAAHGLLYIRNVRDRICRGDVKCVKKVKLLSRARGTAEEQDEDEDEEEGEYPASLVRS